LGARPYSCAAARAGRICERGRRRVKAWQIFLRGFVIVALVALNVRNVAGGDYGLAFVTGCAISVCWWLNAGLASEARKKRAAALWYGLGAGCGTVVGMWVGK
jgi:hypothetical protein